MRGIVVRPRRPEHRRSSTRQIHQDLRELVLRRCIRKKREAVLSRALSLKNRLRAKKTTVSGTQTTVTRARVRHGVVGLDAVVVEGEALLSGVFILRRGEVYERSNRLEWNRRAMSRKNVNLGAVAEGTEVVGCVLAAGKMMDISNRLEGRITFYKKIRKAYFFLSFEVTYPVHQAYSHLQPQD